MVIFVENRVTDSNGKLLRVEFIPVVVDNQPAKTEDLEARRVGPMISR